MRVLIAYDGSPDAQHALALAAGLRWPAPSQLRIVGVVQPISVRVGITPGAVAPAPQIEAAIAAMQEEQVAEAARQLRADHDEVEGVVLRGRPATVLVDEASSFRADVAIAGSRGRGRVASLLLGSVSSELVEHAPCPVLVARSDQVTRIVLAVDGSAPAEAAESLLATWPIFEGLPILVLSVTDMMEPVQFNLAPAAYHQAAADHAAYFEETQEQHTRIAGEAADRLRAAGRAAEPTMRTGGAADEILGLASETGADLIVMGSHGRTGLERIFLGSVARNVLHGSRASVLVVRAQRET